MNLDYELMKIIFNNQIEILNNFFRFITQFGDGMVIWIIITLLFFMFHKLSLKKDFVFITLVYFASFIVNDGIIKLLFKRERPPLEFDFVEPLINLPNSYSFPSGHSASSFVAATILSYYFPRYRWFFYGLALLIAFSRTYLGVHYPSDILVGSLIGFIIAKIGIKIKENRKITSN